MNSLTDFGTSKSLYGSVSIKMVYILLSGYSSSVLISCTDSSMSKSNYFFILGDNDLLKNFNKCFSNSTPDIPFLLILPSS